MCGIAGACQLDMPGEDIPALLARMSHSMVHRGPDDDGAWTLPELRAGLAVRRLSLIDLVTGSQPLLNEDGTVGLVVNGEIYNHVALRRELEERGHLFRSRSDCEVVLHLYEDLGIECLKRLNGMFALAILDRRQRRLLLARDAAGIKPLYHTRAAKGILFASEAKALFASGLVSPAPDWEGINTCLAANYIPAPKTSFQGVERLEAGAYLLVEEGRETRGRFWTMRFDDAPPRRTEKEYEEELECRLRAAVASHLAADVPVGAFLSGGWDSSLLAVFAAQISTRPLKTFSLVFPEEPAENEAQYSRLLAQRISSDHEEVEFRTGQVPELARKIVEAVEEPCAESPAPLYQLASVAGKKVKSVLSGDGSDELLAGYRWFRGHWDWMHPLRRFMPGPLLQPLADRVLDPRWGRLVRFLAAGSDQSANLEFARAFTQRQKRQFFHPELPVANGADLQPLLPPAVTRESCRDRLQEKLSIDFCGRLPEGLLFVLDKISMAHSLELRVPYLDRAVVDFALSLPSSMKIRDGQEKYELSLLAHRHLPARIAGRRKYGLHFPMYAPPGGRFRDFVRETLLKAGRQPELFQRRRLEPWLDDVLAGKRHNMRQVWMLVFFALWWDCFFGG